MGTFYCHQCDTYNDSHDGCQEDPTRENELVCESCYGDLCDAKEEEINGEDYRKPIIAFSSEQRRQIKKLQKESNNEGI
jgi:hypothetical protein